MDYNPGKGLRMPDWITVPEAAEITGYHPDHLRELIRAGKIAAVKKGNAWWVDRSALGEYLANASQSEDSRRGPRTTGKRK